MLRAAGQRGCQKFSGKNAYNKKYPNISGKNAYLAYNKRICVSFFNRVSTFL
jgi:hypothetical protein